MKPIYAETITIGDEILYGQIVDTNSHFMSVKFDQIGIKVIRRTSIGDAKQTIIDALQAAEQVADIILLTGGLGPTKDDITKKVLAEYFGSTLVMNNEVLTHVSNLFTSRGRAMNDSTALQALVPDKATVIHNAVGTAPGMWFEKNGKIFVSMPGVPHETEKMLIDIIIPKLKQYFTLPEIVHRFIKVIGIAESTLSELIESWELALPSHIKLAYLPSKGQIRLRLTALGESATVLQEEIHQQIEAVKPLISKYIYAYDNEEIEQTIGKILLEQNKTIATAESCTGGLLAHSLTQFAGSSRYFLGSVVSYSNASKTDLLGVDAVDIQKFGAVSETVVQQMAIAVREKFKSTIGVATTGVAGPDGGTDEKPVGTVWIAYADEHGVQSKLLTLTQDRIQNINMTKNFVWNYVRMQLAGTENNQ
jgi:nicotinamide-nucleotide amidase